MTEFGYGRLGGSLDQINALPGVATSNAARDNRIYRIAEHELMYFNPGSGGDDRRGAGRDPLWRARLLPRPAGGHLFLYEPLTFLDIGHQIDLMRKLRNFGAAPDVTVVGVEPVSAVTPDGRQHLVFD